MPLISANTILTSISLFHVTLAWFFLTSPSSIADQTLVFIIGEAMGMPDDARSFNHKSSPLALLSALFFVVGISDLVSISLPEEISQYHWGSQAPIRLMLFGGISVYSFFFSATSPLISGIYYPSSWGEGLKNRVVFTWAFVEMLTWFWIWVTLREERRDLLIRIANRRANDEDR
ncbi:hypothetical protein B7494_g1198 [Chlorociboria aeruginascens]|nr:hypothetical protein B7494_g1198 [Chlorociboria aeruginascens]